MNYLSKSALFAVLSLASLAAFGSNINYRIENEHAKAIYDNMTGVQEEGAAGRSFKSGKSILCWHVNADMNDAQGKPMSADDVHRYVCVMKIDSNGLTTSGDQ